MTRLLHEVECMSLCVFLFVLCDSDSCHLWARRFRPHNQQEPKQQELNEHHRHGSAWLMFIGVVCRSTSVFGYL